ncbi:hypothetical protein D3C76_658080 [compost metagenome]
MSRRHRCRGADHRATGGKSVADLVARRIGGAGPGQGHGVFGGCGTEVGRACRHRGCGMGFGLSVLADWRYLAPLEPEDLDEVLRVRIEPTDDVGQGIDGNIELADGGAADHSPLHPRTGMPATGRVPPDHAYGRRRLSGGGDGNRRRHVRRLRQGLFIDPRRWRIADVIGRPHIEVIVGTGAQATDRVSRRHRCRGADHRATGGKSVADLVARRIGGAGPGQGHGVFGGCGTEVGRACRHRGCGMGFGLSVLADWRYLAPLEPEDLDEVLRVRIEPTDDVGQGIDGNIELADGGAADHSPLHPRTGMPATGRVPPDHAYGRRRLSGRGNGDWRHYVSGIGQRWFVFMPAHPEASSNGLSVSIKIPIASAAPLTELIVAVS